MVRSWFYFTGISVQQCTVFAVFKYLAKLFFYGLPVDAVNYIINIFPLKLFDCETKILSPVFVYRLNNTFFVDDNQTVTWTTDGALDYVNIYY